ncbi:MAG: hypothetical protein K6347_06625 [Campylobacterales bacterium]
MSDLADLEMELADLLDRIDLTGDCALLERVATTFLRRIAQTIDKLYDFSALAYALSALASFLGELDPSTLDKRTKEQLLLLLRALVGDLVSWRTNIFVDRSAVDIHYLDSSLLASCMQIEAIIGQKSIITSDSEGDLELF